MACIIFTSGSTGTPKGVQLPASMWFEQIGIHHLPFPASAAELVGAAGSFRPNNWSDGTYSGNFGWILAHGVIGILFNRGCPRDAFNNDSPILVIPEATKLDPLQHRDLLRRHGYSSVAMVPSLLQTYLGVPGALDGFERIQLWGETLKRSIIESAWEQYPDLIF